VMGAHKGFTVKKQPEDGAVVVVPRQADQPVLAEAVAPPPTPRGRGDLRGRSAVDDLAVALLCSAGVVAGPRRMLSAVRQKAPG
jgi:hypothetical protein